METRILAKRDREILGTTPAKRPIYQPPGLTEAGSLEPGAFGWEMKHSAWPVQAGSCMCNAADLHRKSEDRAL